MLKPPLLLRIFGYYLVKAEKKYVTRLQNLFFTAAIVAYPDGENGFYIRARDKQRLLLLIKKERLSVTVSTLLGVPHRLVVNRFRIGVPIGVLLSILLLFMGTNTVWRVEISGNEQISSSVIEEGLSELGFGIGSKTNRENYDDIVTAYRLKHPDIAWMGIYTSGTTAHVRIIENKMQKPNIGEKTVTNLVATEDALVLRLDVAHGKSVVKAGNVVKKGDVLVLGLLGGAHSDTVLPAEGAVIGRVAKDITVEIPYLQTEKVEKKRKILEMDLFFFEKTINIFKKTSKTPMDYVIIERKEELTPAKTALPFGFLVREAVYYQENERYLTKDEAIAEGKTLLDREIRQAVGDGELFVRRAWVEEKEGACVLHATIEFSKNIAEALPFTVS